MAGSIPVQVIWFKRDLRVHDHKPLSEAAQRGPVLPLYIIEPKIIRAPDFDPAHYTFIRACLVELRENLAKLGQPLIVRIGSAETVLQALSRQVKIAHMWAHEETGNALTFERDIKVRAWAQRNAIPLTELPQHGVVRRLKNRDAWANLWEERMREKLTPPPEALQPITLSPGRIPDLTQLKLGRDKRKGAQKGGEAAGSAILNEFLAVRGKEYFGGLAKPELAWKYSSRLSPHITYGSLSLRRVVQGTRRRVRDLQREKPPNPHKKGWLSALKGFESRLHWHCHFIQKLEDEPAIEHHNFLRALDGLREPQFNEAYFEAWQKGRTGYPLVDGAMRALTHTGWLNFRLRAMLVSFASYDLWLHWQRPALHLARLFVDYEPGIHYSQMQMQSGTTGINQMRVYDPTKQAIERDPSGTFIRQWVPELANVPDLFIHEPWRMPPSTQRQVDCVLGEDYPQPIVDHKKASRRAYDRLNKARQRPEAVLEAEAVLHKHGSRRQRRPSKRTKSPSKPSHQLELNLGDV